MSDDPWGVKVSLTQWVRIALKVNVSRYGRQEQDEAANLQASLSRQTRICTGPGNVEYPDHAILPTNHFLIFLY